MNVNLVVSTVAICVIPLIAAYFVMLLMVNGFKWWQGLVSCLCGMISVALIVGLQLVVDFSSIFTLNSLFMVLVGTLVANGLVEELLKAVTLVALPSRIEQRVFFSYGILSGLTFACFETLLYFFAGGEGVSMRFITAVIIHAGCSGLASLTVYGFKTHKSYLFPFILAVLLHGLYDYFALFSNFLGWFKYAVVLVSLIECGVRYSKLKELEKGKR